MHNKFDLLFSTFSTKTFAVLLSKETLCSRYGPWLGRGCVGGRKVGSAPSLWVVRLSFSCGFKGWRRRLLCTGAVNHSPSKYLAGGPPNIIQKIAPFHPSRARRRTTHSHNRERARIYRDLREKKIHMERDIKLAPVSPSHPRARNAPPSPERRVFTLTHSSSFFSAKGERNRERKDRHTQALLLIGN